MILRKRNSLSRNHEQTPRTVLKAVRKLTSKYKAQPLLRIIPSWTSVKETLCEAHKMTST